MEKIKVFLSHSGGTSQKLAEAFYEWLPTVIQTIDAYFSKEMDSGRTWFQDIESGLMTSGYGILFLTPDNLKSPWIHYEAGGLRVALKGDGVTPFLFNVTNSDLRPPISQFQNGGDNNYRHQVFRILKAIDNRQDAVLQNNGTLRAIFDRSWMDLENIINEIETNFLSESPLRKKTINPEVNECLRRIENKIDDNNRYT